MRIHPQGYIPILSVLALLLAAVLMIQLVFPILTVIHYVLYSIGLVFFILVIRFFRRPARVINLNESHVLSAADGKVVVIEEVEENEYYHDRRIQVSVFMSPLNVHVNWYPISGDVKRTIYFKGRKYPAYLPKASTDNERMSIVIEKEDGRSVMMVQIAGIVARRVFTTAREGVYVFQGEEAGIIKFGSRVDLLLPVTAKVQVHVGQKVKACQTVIAKFTEE
jgi:phosphatidylserine decarboxylase